MTAKEAIDILWQYDVNFEPHPAEEVMHAIDMAIEALNAQTEERTEKRTETHACDLISRQEAIDQLHQSYNLLDAEQRLEDLSSAQSQWTPCDWCKYNPPSSMDGKPCTICPAVGRGESDED